MPLETLLGDAALLVVGDIDQLPPIDPGQVLADIIESVAFPMVRLTEAFRQVVWNRIITTAHRINRGIMPNLKKPDLNSAFYFAPAADPRNAMPIILTW